MGERHALVIGSQCAGLPGQTLSFLPERAQRLFDVLTDPARGDCVPAVSRLVLSPELTEMSTAVKEAVAAAGAAGATLLLAFVGHAETLPEPAGAPDLFLMPQNGAVPPDSETGYLLGQRLRELLGGPGASGLDGLVLLLDACHAGVGVLQVAQRAAGVIAATGVRVEMLAATFNRTARDGCFSASITGVLGSGLPRLSADYIDAATTLDLVAEVCAAQEPPLRFAMARGRRIAGDPGLWLARNPEAAGRWALAGTAAGGHAVELTRGFQLTDGIERTMAAMTNAPVTLLVGEAGTGKSALVSALTRPELAVDLIPPGFVHAVAFCALTPTAADIAGELAAQLRRVPGFAQASERYQAGLDPEVFGRQPALERLLLGPLQALELPPGRRLRVVVDGLDQLDPAVCRDLTATFLAAEALPPAVRLLLTIRPGAVASVAGSGVLPTVELTGPSQADIAAFAQARTVSPGLVALLKANAHSWLDLRLLVGALASPGGTGDVERIESLDELYRHRLTDASGALGMHVSPTLAVLAAAGSGPVLPIQLAVAACSRLGGPSDLAGLRDVLAGLGALVARADPGTDTESVGLFHDTLTEHLRRDHERADLNAAHHAVTDALDTEADGDEDEPAQVADYRKLRGPEHLWAVQDYSAALDLIRTTLGPRAADNVRVWQPWLDRATTELGPDHPDTMTTRNNVASWTGWAGDVVGARELLAGLLPDLERVLGPDHPDTLAARNNLASWTGRAGDVVGARELLAGLLHDLERVLGPDHPHTLAARNNLASWTGEGGDVAAARELLAGLLHDLERVLGPDHPGTLAARNNLAFVTGRAGDVVGARDLFAGLLHDLERVLGPDHPDTLAARNNLASWTGEAGDAAGARKLFAVLLADRQRVLGPDHPDTLLTRNNLAAWTGEAGDAAAARKLFAALLPDRQRVLGPDHPDTLLTRNNLAEWAGKAGDAAAARDLVAALLPDRQRVLGPDHPDTLRTRSNVAAWTGKAGDAAAARDLLAALLPDRQRVLGPHHPDTLAARNNLADWTGKAGDAAAARNLLAALLPDRHRVLGPDNPDTLTTRNNLAAWTGEAGDAAAARDLFAALLADRQRVLGPDHPDTLTTRNNLAAWTAEAGGTAETDGRTMR